MDMLLSNSHSANNNNNDSNNSNSNNSNNNNNSSTSQYVNPLIATDANGKLKCPHSCCTCVYSHRSSWTNHLAETHTCNTECTYKEWKKQYDETKRPSGSGPKQRPKPQLKTNAKKRTMNVQSHKSQLGTDTELNSDGGESKSDNSSINNTLNVAQCTSVNDALIASGVVYTWGNSPCLLATAGSNPEFSGCGDYGSSNNNWMLDNINSNSNATNTTSSTSNKLCNSCDGYFESTSLVCQCGCFTSNILQAKKDLPPKIGLNTMVYTLPEYPNFVIRDAGGTAKNEPWRTNLCFDREVRALELFKQLKNDLKLSFGVPQLVGKSADTRWNTDEF